MQLTKDQRTFLVLKFNEIKGYRQVKREFEVRFPDRNSPDKKTILRTVQKFNAHGTILNRNKGQSGRLKSQRTPEKVAQVQGIIQETPHSSMRRNESNIPRSSFHRILQKDLHYHPYKMQVKHQLLDGDYPRRRDFCRWLTGKGPRFLNNVIMTDEAAFSMNGTVNTQNTRHWSEGKPDRNVFEESMRREKLSVWAGVCGNGRIVGPIFYEGALNGDSYNDMLNETIIPSVQQAYGGHVRTCWFMQDGAPAHRRLIIRDTLRRVFQSRIIGIGFDKEWPPRSPDLTPCDFFLWGHLKNQVYKTPPPTLEILRDRVEAEFDVLKNDPAAIRKVMQSMRDRATRCLARHGRHVEGY